MAGVQGYAPGGAGDEFGNLNANPQSSNYQDISATANGTLETILLMKAIKKVIFDAAPEQYNALKLLYEKPFIEVGSDEFEYLEHTFGRDAITATGSAVAASSGAYVQATLTLAANDTDKLTIDEVLVYPNGTKAVIKSINEGAGTIVVESQVGIGLPAITAESMSIQSTIAADGMSSFSNYERIETVTRYNFIQFFLRAERWAEVELQKYINQGTTNYLDIQKQHKLKQLRIDLFNTFFNGTRGEFRLAGSQIAKSTGGIFPTMVAAGSANSNPTLAGLQTAFEQLAFATNYKKEGQVRIMYGTDQILNEFSKIYKQPGLRYSPNDDIAKLGLNQIELGTMKFVLVPCELFRETSCFPSEWQRKVLVLDQETISPVKMRGLDAMRMGQTISRKDNPGSREAFTDWWVWAQMGVQFHNPLASFYLDIQ